MEKYEAPEVITFGELDFEPTSRWDCTSMVTCAYEIGHGGDYDHR